LRWKNLPLIGLGKRLQNDLFCAGWYIKLYLNQSINTLILTLTD